MPATDTDIDVSTHVQALARASGAIPSTDAQAAATRPIGLSDWAAPGSRAVEGIVDRYWRAGFAVVAAQRRRARRGCLGWPRPSISESRSSHACTRRTASRPALAAWRP